MPEKAIIFVFLIYFIPRIIGLGFDIYNYDADYWYPRMENFTKYLLRGDFKNTYQKYHPGVTLLWTSGTSTYIFEKSFQTIFKQTEQNPRFKPYVFPFLHLAAKIPLITIISLLGILIYSSLSKMVNKKFALIFSIVLSFEPFFLGISRFLHLSALTAMFMFASFAVLLEHYITKRKDYKYFVFSAIFLSLGMLTKIDAFIVLPINGLCILYYEYRENIAKYKIINPIKNGLLYLIITAGTFYALFPSMWTAPVWTLHSIYEDGIKDTAFSSSGAETLLGIRYLFYPETIFFRSLPTFFIGIIGGALFLANCKKLIASGRLKSENTPFLLWTAFYILFNIVILTIPEKIKDRYAINLYPPLAVFTAFFIYIVLKSKSQIYKWLVIGSFGFFYLLTIYRYHPVYSAYYSDFIKGPGGYIKLDLPLKNRGEFYAQAAQYINKNDPLAGEKKVIISERERIKTFSPFFFGEAFTNPKYMNDRNNADYIITEPQNEHLIENTDLKDKCQLDRGFGPKDPFGYYILKLYKCQGITNDYKEFRN